MLEKEAKKYRKYLEKRNSEKTSWFNRIRFWKYLKEDYENAKIENMKKQSKLHRIEQELSSTQISLSIACERIEQLEYDLKQKKNKKKKKEDK